MVCSHLENGFLYFYDFPTNSAKIVEFDLKYPIKEGQFFKSLNSDEIFAFFEVQIEIPHPNSTSKRVPIYHVILEESKQISFPWNNNPFLSKCDSISQCKANFTWKKLKYMNDIFKDIFYFEETYYYFLISEKTSTMMIEFVDQDIISSCQHAFFFKTFPLKNAKNFVYFPFVGFQNILNGQVHYNKEFYCISKDNELCLFFNRSDKIVKIYQMKNVPMFRLNYALVQEEGLMDQKFENSFSIQDSIEDMQFSEDSEIVYILEKNDLNIHIFSIYSLNDNCFTFCKMFNLGEWSLSFQVFQNWIYLMNGNDIVHVLEMKVLGMKNKLNLDMVDVHFKFE
jgi:hypothetical protein